MFGGFFFFWAFPWDGRALRFKSSPKGCGLYSAIPNAWLKSPLAGVLLHTASCVLVMLLLNCRFFSVRVWRIKFTFFLFLVCGKGCKKIFFGLFPYYV